MTTPLKSVEEQLQNLSAEQLRALQRRRRKERAVYSSYRKPSAVQGGEKTRPVDFSQTWTSLNGEFDAGTNRRGGAEYADR